ncbi:MULTISPECIES: hypothetical protein [Acinetobacter]|jgi:hypothetical protein|uniref:hypothetical protein n=1 Tax=Acinetobacter TaxID=469 RepID=UPI0009003771|nr:MULTISPECIES: hypothetical protein [Acinetobacter]MCO8079275.1 hypothetical protein [Acinetobacter lwoffii]OIU78272.1 hypothetical protein BFN00_14670 [Acinetobacter sp. AR2-3]PJI34811.1 hypothetical protein CU318_09860 [Acinetobacter pseudolwoffii]
MGILTIVGIVFVLMWIDQYIKDEDERERKKKEIEEQKRLELLRQQELKARQEQIDLQVYKEKLRQKILENDKGLSKDQVLTWILIIVIAVLIVFAAVWFS